MKKYAIVGAGGRGLWSFAKPLSDQFKDHAELVGVCDINPVRARNMSEACGNPPVYTDFDEMLDAVKPDSVIVTTIDSFHDEYIIRALEAGCDAISEKPMTTDADKCRAILEAERRTGKKVTVTFNCRFIPYVQRVKELIVEGAIGDVLHAHLEWSLDRSHGADYFRRWHRNMANSGGLLVHKSTHHFDMANWWLNDEPETVQAFGARSFYGPTREERGERCLTCAYKQSCEYYLDITRDSSMRELYLDAESEDGYYRDKCVFSDEIDIYDTMSVSVKYAKGTLLSYSLCAFSPYEGWRATLVGTKGRMEFGEFYSGPHAGSTSNDIRIYKPNGELATLQIPKAGGGHGGGDERMLRMIFAGDIDDPLGQQAGSRAGAMSMLIGAAANVSIREGRPVGIGDLLTDN